MNFILIALASTTAGVDLWFRDSDYIGHSETSIGGMDGKIISSLLLARCPRTAKIWKHITGNSDSADGPYVIELGFRPALV